VKSPATQSDFRAARYRNRNPTKKHTAVTTADPDGIGIGERIKVEKPAARTKTARSRARAVLSVPEDLNLRIAVILRDSRLPTLVILGL
jgi:hypothetical protein